MWNKIVEAWRGKKVELETAESERDSWKEKADKWEDDWLAMGVEFEEYKAECANHDADYDDAVAKADKWQGKYDLSVAECNEYKEALQSIYDEVVGVDEVVEVAFEVEEMPEPEVADMPEPEVADMPEPEVAEAS